MIAIQETTGDHCAHLWPDAVAMGDGPFGGRGSSQVLISISTLSRVCKQVMGLTSQTNNHSFYCAVD